MSESRRRSGPTAATGDDDRRRIDRWLWFARFARTRTVAQKLVTAGHVRVNRDKIDSPGRAIRIGDVLTLALPSGVRVVRVEDLGERRGPPAEARALFRDMSDTNAHHPSRGEDFSGPGA